MQRNSHPAVLTWDDFDIAVTCIAAHIKTKHSAVMGLPRGGLPLAVALSHRLQIPLISGQQFSLLDTRADVLIVDDMVETGSTLDPFVGSYEVWTWVAKGWMGDGVNFVTRANPSQWIVFPWEDLSTWSDDASTYNLSRNV
jgi:hypoxanthine phosphoribosyltransferase